MKSIIISFFLLLSLMVPVGIHRVALAQGQYGQPTVVELTNPIGSTATNKKGTTDWYVFLGTIIQYALGVMGSITLVVFMYGGFLWLTSAGSEDKVHTGLQTMLYACIGIFIIFGAYAILNTIFSGLRQ